jgi:carbon-monoxide dehydrogenase medium subunit
MKDFEYHSPPSLQEACELLKKYGGKARVLAGGTDLLYDLYHREIAPNHVINIKRIPDLNNIDYDKSKGLILGPLVNFNELIYSEIVKKHYPILAEVSKRIASHQIRNLATIGGNLCNAASSADSSPILMALDSEVTITGSTGNKQTLPLEKFFTGSRETVLKAGEILTQIHIPPIKERSGMFYKKYIIRQSLEIAVVGVAAFIQLEKGSEKCSSARIVIGACAPTPLRVFKAEKILVGKKISADDIEAAAKAASAAAKPISDVRASDSYRKEMVKVQCRRVIKEALARGNSRNH